MLNQVIADGRRLVTIIDPHVKRDPDYFVYRDCSQRGILVENSQNETYHGKCWPNVSAWIDYMNLDSALYLRQLYVDFD